MQKTLAMKALEGAGVPYEALNYPADERDAERVAVYLQALPGQVLKTLVVTRPQGKPILIMIPADKQLDLKALAAELGEKKLAMAGHEEAERLTRLEVGGISALALLNKPFTILIDNAARGKEYVYVSAGRKGTNLRVPLAGLVQATGARWVSASR